VFRSLRARAFTTLFFVSFLVTATGPAIASAGVVRDTLAETTECHDAALPRQRTEVDADIAVPRFDPTLGTLLEVTVPEQAVHLDTDARFENTAQTAVSFAEHMDYQVTFTSPGGLASPAALVGTIERVPAQTLPAFDGTLDFAGTSAVTQPATTRDASAAPVASTDPGVLGAFTGAGTVAFHVASVIGETFMGGGGNVEAQIHTFASATVRVCYRYAPPVTPPTTTPPVEVGGEVVTVSRRGPTLPRTGSGTAVLAAVGVGAIAIGAGLAATGRRPRPRLDA
jgi:LPXTG-motif cell wall-anchored protein